MIQFILYSELLVDYISDSLQGGSIILSSLKLVIQVGCGWLPSFKQNTSQAYELMNLADSVLVLHAGGRNKTTPMQQINTCLYRNRHEPKQNTVLYDNKQMKSEIVLLIIILRMCEILLFMML